jgi:hypothetical protein
MKRIIKLTATLLAVLLALTSCSAVFDSAISGTIKDRSVRETSSTSSGGISDVMVYAYDSESDWNNKYSAWDGKSVFTDNSVPSAKTAADGSFSISNLRWMTTSPAYGKDADSKTIYLLAFHKDYGLIKVDGRTIQSDKSNNFGIVYMDKATVTKTLVVKLKDKDDNSTTAAGSDATITDTTGFSFQYKYSDGYGEKNNITGKVDTFTNGQATITVKYKEYEGNTDTKAAVPEVTLYNIETGSDWTLETKLDDNNEITFTYDTEKKDYASSNLVFSNEWKTVTVTVDLIDGSSSDLSSVTDPIYFKWSYDNGEETKSGNETTTSGSATVSVKFRKSLAEPKLILSAFDDNDNTDDKWTWTESETDAAKRTEDIEVKLSSDKDNVTQKVYFRKNYIQLTTDAVHGYLISSSGTGEATGYGYKSDTGDRVILYLGGEAIDSILTGQETVASSSTTSIVNYGHFSGLGRGTKLNLTYDDTASPVSYKGTPEKELTLNYIKCKETKTALTEPVKIDFDSTTTDFSVMLYK